MFWGYSNHIQRLDKTGAKFSKIAENRQAKKKQAITLLLYFVENTE